MPGADASLEPQEHGSTGQGRPVGQPWASRCARRAHLAWGRAWVRHGGGPRESAPAALSIAICPAKSGCKLWPSPRGARAQGRGARPAEQACGHMRQEATLRTTRVGVGSSAQHSCTLLLGRAPLLRQQQAPRIHEALREWRHVTAPHGWATKGHRAQAGYNLPAIEIASGRGHSH